MAIEAVSKITVIVHGDLEDQVVDTLTRLGTVHIKRVAQDEGLVPKQLSDEEVQNIRKLTYSIVQVEFVLGFLQENAAERPGFIGSMLKDKYQMTVDDFMRSSHRINLEMLYAECSEFQRQLVALQDSRARLDQERVELEHWTQLQMPLNQITGGEAYGLLLVRITSLDFDPVMLALESEAPESSVEVVGEKEPWISCLVLYHPSVQEAVRGVLSRFRCETVQLPKLPDEPDERLEQVLREIAAIDRKRSDLLVLVKKYLERVPALEVHKEFLVNERNQVEIGTNFGVTRSTVAVEGWVTGSGVKKTIARLEELSDDLSVEITDPAEDEIPPVSLKNPDWVRPFELLVKLYGSPGRPEYDPTIIVAISFMIFFGFCIGDVGYGIVLIPTFLLLRKYLPLGRKAKDLLTVLAYGSACAIIVGVPTGGWFGIELDKLPQAIKSLAVLDGLTRTMTAMGVAIGIGLVHMLIGTGIEFRDNWRHGSRTDALIDQGLVFLLFIGGGLGIGLKLAGVVPAAVPLAIIGVTILGMLFLLGRSAKGIAGKAVNGLYETYGTVVGYVSDSISYVRLFALGLSTVIIALVVNNMAGLVFGVGPVIGLILMILVLVVGHTFNIAINLLGAFVHPLRLEFVEFFGKFYEDGGEEFKPHGIESKIVIIEDQEGS